MESYKLTHARVVSSDPLTVEWCGEFTLEDGSKYVPGIIRLSAAPPADAPATWVDYTPAARAALSAASPTDKAAILSAIHLDAQRVLAEVSAVRPAPSVNAPTNEDLLTP